MKLRWRHETRFCETAKHRRFRSRVSPRNRRTWTASRSSKIVMLEPPWRRTTAREAVDERALEPTCSRRPPHQSDAVPAASFGAGSKPRSADSVDVDPQREHIPCPSALACNRSIPLCGLEIQERTLTRRCPTLGSGLAKPRDKDECRSTQAEGYLPEPERQRRQLRAGLP